MTTEGRFLSGASIFWRIFLANFFDKLCYLGFLTIASFRIGVPSVLFINKNSQERNRFVEKNILLGLFAFNKIFEFFFVWFVSNKSLSQIILRSNILRHHFYLPKVTIQVQNGNGVLKRLVPCLKCMELACWVLQSSLKPVLLP